MYLTRNAYSCTQYLVENNLRYEESAHESCKYRSSTGCLTKKKDLFIQYNKKNTVHSMWLGRHRGDNYKDVVDEYDLESMHGGIRGMDRVEDKNNTTIKPVVDTMQTLIYVC